MFSAIEVNSRTPEPSGPWHILKFDGGIAQKGKYIYTAWILGIIRSPDPAVPYSQLEWTTVAQDSFVRPSGTSNEAEYHALLDGLRQALRLSVRNLMVYGDSKLIINQTRGDWKVKKASLRPLRNEAFNLAKMYENVVFRHIRRDLNSDVDKLVNLAKTGYEPENMQHAPEWVSLDRTPKVAANKRKYTANEAALMKYFWQTGKCTSIPVLRRIFGGTERAIYLCAANKTYRDICEKHLIFEGDVEFDITKCDHEFPTLLNENVGYQINTSRLRKIRQLRQLTSGE